MNIKASCTPIFFIGIGGIGMSAIARYFLLHGFKVGGYDRTESHITRALVAEGAEVFYTDSSDSIPETFRSETTYVIYTPAVPADSSVMSYYREHGIPLYKRSQALGEITSHSKALCVAGTHGKTTTSTILACLMARTVSPSEYVGVNAFLGGISLNYNSNLLLDAEASFTVAEADEYDRSFHTLHPHYAIITSSSPDHLDIYGTEEAYLEAFSHFTSLISPEGGLVIHKHATCTPRLQKGAKCYTYAKEEQADFYSDNLQFRSGELYFDFHFPGGVYKEMHIGVPIAINVENATAALAVAHLCGKSEVELRHNLSAFKGVHRRFERVLSGAEGEPVLIDDYAHHPEEIAASIRSVRILYPKSRLTAIFQPHLYSRTADFYKEFAESLSQEAQVVLLPIYPAREEPIPGVTSELILEHISSNVTATCCSKAELTSTLDRFPADVYLMLGAGDIELLVPEVKDYLIQKNKKALS
ncbi:MAG: UDP-N-acetylmuramate--L-alanine ligase [Porphyromonas sp.]|nr:UDP-N-acetylmuramate--L-alanine ligase [Porphyromonas sp.]